MDALAIRENVTSNVWNCVINRERENKKKQDTNTDDADDDNDTCFTVLSQSVDVVVL